MDVEVIVACGYVCHDAERKINRNGKPLVFFDIGVNKRKNETQFYNVFAYGSLGEICLRYIKKGMRVLVVGEPYYRILKRPNGNPFIVATISAERVNFLSSKRDMRWQNDDEYNQYEELNDFDEMKDLDYCELDSSEFPY